jgi:hypothetical protein
MDSSQSLNPKPYTPHTPAHMRSRVCGYVLRNVRSSERRREARIVQFGRTDALGVRLGS